MDLESNIKPPYLLTEVEGLDVYAIVVVFAATLSERPRSKALSSIDFETKQGEKRTQCSVGTSGDNNIIPIDCHVRLRNPRKFTTISCESKKQQGL
jgi:hypothetical protein